jgi:hypothetical protein
MKLTEWAGDGRDINPDKCSTNKQAESFSLAHHELQTRGSGGVGRGKKSK